MSQFAKIVSDNFTVLWGLKPAERIHKQLLSINISLFPDCSPVKEPKSSVLLIDSNFLFDTHTLKNFVQSSSEFLICDDTHIIAALKCDYGKIDQYKQIIGSVASHQIIDNKEAGLQQYNDKLRQSKPPMIKHIPSFSVEELESLMYGNSYKGITDFVTKWWWPRPAKKIAKLCVDFNITPNTVTIVGALLMLLALMCFVNGLFVLGLLSGWIMTLLDTVDGKLARVTECTSKTGHILDHGMDIIHPPIWYFYWGASLSGAYSILGYSFYDLSVIMIYAYIGGRIAEGLFEGLGNCSLFAWRPIDAYFRLFVARRNPCLVILTVATVMNQPSLAFLGVVGWTLVSTILLVFRLSYAVFVRISEGQLESWLQDPRAAELSPTAFKTFSKTEQAYDS
jgi:phosphatidylglycerophosphate synthase